jgi:hypothetical protein
LIIIVGGRTANLTVFCAPSQHARLGASLMGQETANGVDLPTVLPTVGALGQEFSQDPYGLL